MDPEDTLIGNSVADVYQKDMSPSAGFGHSARAYQIARPMGQLRLDLKVSEATFPDTVAGIMLISLIERTRSLAARA